MNPKIEDYQNTPWGAADHVTEIALGLVRVRTPRHGGYHLSGARAAQVARIFPGFRPFTQSWHWLEEDIDALLTVIAWPELVTQAAAVNAYNTLRLDHSRDYFNIPADWFETSPHAATLAARALGYLPADSE